MAASLPVPVRLLHLNELDDDLRAAVAATAGAGGAGARGVAPGASWSGAAELDEMAGSVARFEAVAAPPPREATRVTSWLPTLVWCALVAVFAGLSNVWNGHDPGWYAALAAAVLPAARRRLRPDVAAQLPAAARRRPHLDPHRSGEVAWTATGVLAVSVVLALGWAWLFYVPHQLGAAAACLAGAAVLTWVLLVVVARHETWAGLLLAPYALWLSVATALSVAYARLN